MISLTGGSLQSILIGTKSLISDTSKPADRTPRLAVNETVRTMAQFLGFTLSGALINTLGAEIVCLGCLTAFLVSTVNCFLLPDSRAKRNNSYSQLFRLYYPDKRYETEERARLSIWLSILGRLSFSAPQNLFVIYLISEPFNFNATFIGVFLGYKTLALSVICLLYTLIPSDLTGTLKDSDMISAGLSLLSVSYLFFMVSTTTATLFLAATLNGMFGMAAVSFNSLLSKSVPEEHLAHTFAITTGVERLLLCAVTPAISFTYQNTRTWPVHGFCFVIPLVLTLISGIILIVHWEHFRISDQTRSLMSETLPVLGGHQFKGYTSCGELNTANNTLLSKQSNSNQI